ncbi:nucleoside-diphosphate-sugar epimerase [Psychromicrobium silvestre]|uniref:Nucleoside-diphosphate-sugar epimerase n=1 Tax=Psychromicrobium silvestre TaxID=1645614 RepID=A0A7Y9S656_9MICC|nr:SDR family oxidoreductase [Psychromicrobium silvestre]NYE94431.1 nucleoside-diphosphate-sugar epimerase [Psychromicrobium silvestre]
MRVFVTGATGGIGSAVVSELISAGHQVLGLARSAASAERLIAAGAVPLVGDLADANSLRTGVEQTDGVIQLAFSNDFTRIEEGIAEEKAAVEAIGAALIGSHKPIVFASGTPAAPGRVTTEEEPMSEEGPMGGRARNARYLLELAEQGVRSSVVRLPRSVHQRGVAYGFASFLIETARHTGVSGYVGDGSQRWPAVHRLDAAHLFRIMLEDAAPGSIAHAVGDEGDTMRSLAEAIGGALGLPVEQVAAEQYGFLGTVFEVDQPSSSFATQRRFGWEPSHPSLLADLEAGNYPLG